VRFRAAQSSLPQLDYSPLAAREHLTALELSDQLQRNLRQEQGLQLELSTTFFSQVLLAVVPCLWPATCKCSRSRRLLLRLPALSQRPSSIRIMSQHVAVDEFVSSVSTSSSRHQRSTVHLQSAVHAHHLYEQSIRCFRQDWRHPAEVLSPCAGIDADPDGDSGDGVVPLVARQAGHPPLHRAARRRNGADRCKPPSDGNPRKRASASVAEPPEPPEHAQLDSVILHGCSACTLNLGYSK